MPTPTLNPQKYLEQIGATLVTNQVGPNGRPLVSKDGNQFELDMSPVLEKAARDAGIKREDLKLGDLNTPDQAFTVSPLSIPQREAIYTARTEKDAVKYLKQSFDDVKVHPDKGLLVKQHGVWREADPSMFANGLSIESLKEFGKDALVKGVPEAISAGLGAAATPFVTPAGGRAIQGASGALIRSTMGQILGTRNDSPEILAQDMATEAVLAVAMGAAGEKLLSSAPVQGIKRGIVALGKKMAEEGGEKLASVLPALSKVSPKSATMLASGADKVSALIGKPAGELNAMALGAAQTARAGALKNLETQLFSVAKGVTPRGQMVTASEEAIRGKIAQVANMTDADLIKSYMHGQLDHMADVFPKDAVNRLTQAVAAAEYSSFIPGWANSIKDMLKPKNLPGASIAGYAAKALVPAPIKAAAGAAAAPLVILASPRLQYWGAKSAQELAGQFNNAMYYTRPGQLAIKAGVMAKDAIMKSNILDADALTAITLGIKHASEGYDETVQQAGAQFQKATQNVQP